MRHSYIRFGQLSHEPYEVLNTTANTISTFEWNPPKHGGHLHVVLSGGGNSVDVSFAGGFAPREGDILCLTVTQQDAQQGDVGFLGKNWLGDMTPAEFMYKRAQSDGLSYEWVLTNERPRSRHIRHALSYSRVLEFSRSMETLPTPGDQLYRQTYARELSDGTLIVSFGRFQSGIDAPGRVWVARRAGDAFLEEASGTPPYTLRRAERRSDGRFLLIGDTLEGAATNTTIFRSGLSDITFAAVALPFAFSRNACPPVVLGDHVLVGSSTGGIAYSSDFGATWSTVHESAVPKRLYLNSTHAFYGDNTAVYRAALGSNSWSTVLSLGAECTTLCEGLGGVGVIAGNGSDGVLRYSLDNGGTWASSAITGYTHGFIFNGSLGLVETVSGTLSNAHRLHWTDSYRGFSAVKGGQFHTSARYTLGDEYNLDFQLGARGMYIVSPDGRKNVNVSALALGGPGHFRYLSQPDWNF